MRQGILFFVELTNSKENYWMGITFYSKYSPLVSLATEG